MASAGMAERRPASRRRAARRRSAARSRRGCRTARPGPGPRARRRRGPRPGRGRTRRPGASSRARGRAPRARGVRPRLRVARPRPLARPPAAPSTICAEHELDDPLLGALGHVDDADRLALAQDRRPVADRGDLDQAVGDEDDRAVAAALAADDLEDPLGEVRGQRRGHLVEHQHVGLDGERAGQVDDPERGERQPPRHARQVEVRRGRARASQWRNGSTRRLGQPQVGPDVEVGDERRLLVDGDEAAAARLGRASGPSRSRPRTAIVPASGRTAPVRILTRVLLPAPLAPMQRVDLARADGQGRGPAARRRRRSVFETPVASSSRSVAVTVIGSCRVNERGCRRSRRPPSTGLDR